jgi:hypothetical protein
MPEKIAIVVVEDGSRDYEDLVPSIRTACISRSMPLREGTEYEILPAASREAVESLLADLEKTRRQRVIVILDLLIEKDKDMLDTYIATNMRGESNPWRRRWPIIVYSRFSDLPIRVKYHENIFIASKLPRRGRDVWEEFRDSLGQCLDLVSDLEES